MKQVLPRMSFIPLVSMLIACAFLPPAYCRGGTISGRQPSGALYQISVPSSWNGDLVVYSHGYESPTEPIAIPNDTFADGVSISGVLNDMGLAYATSSFRANGLVTQEAIQDLLELVNLFKTRFGKPKHILLFGPSAGGLIATLSLERYPDIYDGGLVACSPIGDFQSQINYVSDFRAVFDVFFPGVIPGNVTQIPREALNNWYTVYEPKIRQAVYANPHATRQVLNVTGAAYDPNLPGTIGETFTGVLWYHVFASANAEQVLGGQPFDNARRMYSGSGNDPWLNSKVVRVSASPTATANVKNYQTSGKLRVPLVSLHTSLDEIVPAWHQDLYASKVAARSLSDLFYGITIDRYGHVNLTVSEFLSAYMILRHKMILRDQSFLISPSVSSTATEPKKSRSKLWVVKHRRR